MMWLVPGLLVAPPALAQEAGEPDDGSEAVEEDCEEVEGEEGTCPDEEPEGPPPPEYGYFTETLDNGLKVSVLSDPAHPVVSTQTWVAVGSAQEGPDQAGFAHLFEHFMFGATHTYGKEVYALHHTHHGGTENAYTAFDNTVYISEIPPEFHDFVLQLEANRLTDLILDQENLDNEKKIVTEELRLRTENDPFGRLAIAALAGLFGEHPYGHSPAGTKADIEAADLVLCRQFYEGYYRPGNLHLVVVGPVNGPWTLERIREYYGDLPAERVEPPAVPALADWDFPARVELRDDLPPIKLGARVYVVPAPGTPDYWAMQVLGQMLAGGAVDYFREELVTRRGKALDGGGFYIDEFRAGGLMVFGALYLPFRSERRALRLVGQTLDTLNEKAWLTQENLDTARRALLRQELEGRYYAASRADDIGRAWGWMGDDQLGVDGFAEHFAGVTLADVESAWDSYIARAEPVEVFIERGSPQ